MTRIAIVAALPGELKPLVRGWQHERRNAVHLWRRRQPQGEWIAGCAGMGQAAATRAFAEIERAGSIDCVISTGWAGGLGTNIVAGKAYCAGGVIDLKTGERFFRPGSKSEDLLLVTSPKVVLAREKDALAVGYCAALVDMEAAAIARLARMRGIPFLCIKGVSDGLGENLPDFNGFISPAGQLRVSRLLFFVLLRPWYWPALIRMGDNSRKASQAIKELLLENLEKQNLENPGAVANRNGDSNFAS